MRIDAAIFKWNRTSLFSGKSCVLWSVFLKVKDRKKINKKESEVIVRDGPLLVYKVHGPGGMKEIKSNFVSTGRWVFATLHCSAAAVLKTRTSEPVVAP